MRIIYTKTTKLYLQELVHILYEKKYFGFEEYAHKYVDKITTEIEYTIHIRSKRKAPTYFLRYGKGLWYVFYSPNKQTTWYFFFTHHTNNTYVIRYITNNHVAGHLL